jgi:hypothetical protein
MPTLEYSLLNATKPINWRGIRTVDKLSIVALPLLAVATLAFRYLDEAYLRRLARALGAQPVIIWLANGYTAWILAAGLLLLGVGYFLWWRQRLANDKRLWCSTGCPYCQERELVRVKRTTRDRLYKYAAIPVYRFACRNCSWRGLRIGRQEISPERERELEEALLRFQPDGLPVVYPSRTSEQSDSELAVMSTAIDSEARSPGVEYAKWMEEYVPITRDDAGQELVEPPNHHADVERLDDMEWLWRRPSDV